jgi:hypothetical protein
MAARKSSGPVRRKNKPEASRAGRSAPEDIKNYKQSLALANRLNKVAPDEDNAVVAGAIVLFAAEVIKRSSGNVLEARAYLEGMRSAIDGLLANAFQDAQQARPEPKATRGRR